MKRFSVLVLLIAIIFSTTNLLYKQTHYTEVKETDYGTQEIKRDGNCATVTDNIKFVSDTNISDAHMVDACCIASMGSEFHNENSNEYKKKCVSKGNHARTGVKGGRFVFLPSGKISGFKRYDKVLYNNKEYFVTGRMSNGYITLTDIDGNKPQVGSVKRSTGEKYLSLAKIKVSLVKKISSAKTCICTSV